MKRDLLSEPRSQLIVRLTQAAIRASGLTVNSFATRVAEAYVERVALHERTMDFHFDTGTVDSVERSTKANGQLIARIINGLVKMPCDLEEAWIAALPDSHRDAAITTLAERYGLLGAVLPASACDGAGQMQQFGALSREFGEAISAMSGIYADGQCDARDAQRIPAAVRELDDLIAAAVTLRAQMRRVQEGAA